MVSGLNSTSERCRRPFGPPRPSIALVHKRDPLTRNILLPSPRANDHPPKRTRGQPLHARALPGRPPAPDEEEVREHAEDVVLRRHERDLLRGVLRERVARVHEARLDDFLPAVGRGQAVLGLLYRAGQERDVEARVETAVCKGYNRGGGHHRHG